MTNDNPQSAPDGRPPSFESALSSLEQVVQELEEGQITLTEALARYESGVRLLRECYRILEGAERRIELLRGIGEGGEAITVPFDDPPAATEEKPVGKSRRSAREKPTPVKEPARGDAPCVDDAQGLF